MEKGNSMLLKSIRIISLIVGSILIILQLLHYITPPEFVSVANSREIVRERVTRSNYFFSRPYSMIINGHIGGGLGYFLGTNGVGILGIILFIIGKKKKKSQISDKLN